MPLSPAFFGDGAINRGPFLEGLNWAQLFRLPVLFVCEDNGVAAFTDSSTVTAGAGASARAEAAGVTAAIVDGNDVIAVNDLANKFISEIRSGGGPRLLQAKTYRWTGHTSTDPAAWRDPAEVEAWKARCPINRLKQNLFGKGMSANDLDAIATAAHEEMQAARAAANAASWPASAVAYEDVQDTGAVTA